MFFERFEDNVRENPEIVAAVEAGQWDRVIDYINREVFDKPEASTPIPTIKTYFKAYATSGRVRDIIDSGQLTDLATNPTYSTRDFKAVPPNHRSLVPAYVKDYVPLNQLM